jgi:ankyrin repeat protein
MPKIRLARKFAKDTPRKPLHLQYLSIDSEMPERRCRSSAQKKLNWMLLIAARDGQKGAAKRLLRSGACLLAMDKEGRTPLHHAAFQGRARMVKLLIGHARSQKNGAARGMLLAGTSEGRWTPLHCAAWRGHSRACDIILNAAQEIGLLKKVLAAKDSSGNDALRRARQSNCQETLGVLSRYEDIAAGPAAGNRNI